MNIESKIGKAVSYKLIFRNEIIYFHGRVTLWYEWVGSTGVLLKHNTKAAWSSAVAMLRPAESTTGQIGRKEVKKIVYSMYVCWDGVSTPDFF